MIHNSEKGFSPVIVVFGAIMLIAAGFIIANRNPMNPQELPANQESVLVASPSASLVASASATIVPTYKPTVKPTAKTTIVPTAKIEVAATQAPAATPNAAEEDEKKKKMIEEALKKSPSVQFSEEDKKIIFGQ